MDKPFYILSLDGGGSLGVYTLGVLVEIERMLGMPLHRKLGLVYGTSTGAIIASMIALGEDADVAIRKRYFAMAPDVMRRFSARSKSNRLQKYARQIYGDKTFEDLCMDIGIVATHVEYNRPTVFKRTIGQAHGTAGSFSPGFGVKISDAVVASCSAFPLFKKKVIVTPRHGKRTIIDGGFTANNPTLFALTDALGPLQIPRGKIRILSIGTGNFPDKLRLRLALCKAFPTTRILLKLLKTSSNTVETLRQLIFQDIKTVRIDDAYNDFKTDFTETDPKKLQHIFQLGRESFRKAEKELQELLSGN